MAKLAYQAIGDSMLPKLVILHGLLGSSRNWATFAKQISADFHVFTVDLRNHGDSEFCDTMSYDEMASDVVDFLDEQGIDSCELMGHSMGGKVAMELALHHGGRVNGLYIIDIAPKPYKPHYYETLRLLDSLDLESFSNRKELEAALSEHVEDWAFRQFILTNVKRDKETGFYWTVNLPAIVDQLDVISTNPIGADESFDGKAVFIAGESSDFIQDKDHPAIYNYFPNATIHTIAGGHNLHIENRDGVVEVLNTAYSSK